MSIDIARSNMILNQIRPQHVTQSKILDTIARVPREDFVPAEYQAISFTESVIPLAHNQYMLPPYLEAQMLQALEIKPTDKILEIGTGSGYFTALLSKLAQWVFTVDCFESFIEEATEKFRQHGLINITATKAKAENGWPHQAPYNAIVLTGSVPHIPESIKQDLAIGGKLVAVVGTYPMMKLTRLTRVSQTYFKETILGETSIPRLLDIKENNLFKF